jgi:DNA helicase-2/ATP-dependent DNA helicase PcrA
LTQTDILAQLNPRQREAAEAIDGPLLIVAGPGSGKTRLITYRIAYLVRVVGVPARRIAALTFTNKAAREMRSRLGELVSHSINDMSVGTFHSFCAMTLRWESDAIGLDRNFAIYDDPDQLDVIKRSMRETDVDPKRFSPRAVQSAISKAKSSLLGSEGFGMRTASYFEEVVGRVFERYELLMAQSGAVDFDDLLLKTHQMLEQHPEIAARYQDRYVHFMIDEFQDTNVVQYAIARKLTEAHRNLCVVGDPDQSIYSWRNADIRNILSFQDDFPDAKLIPLEQNYRSTQTILDAADKLISANSQRIERELFTDNGDGVPIVVSEGYDEAEEAQMTLKEIGALTKNGPGAQGGYKLGDIAIMYRVNAQSRALEEECLRYGVPYQLIGGQKFYQRQEVKDVTAYLRLVANTNDDVSLNRIINLPTRGIGRRTLDELARLARDSNMSQFDAISSIMSTDDQLAPAATNPFTPRATRALTDFQKMINGLRADLDGLSIIDLIDQVLERTGYQKYLTDSAERGEERIENINEFKTAARDYIHMPVQDGLTAFMESVSLVSDIDKMEDRTEAITLITLHQAKGLEYPVVFIVGMEEGLLPHSRSMDDPTAVEEERRLAYVGVTRAKERLYLMRTFRRGFWGASGPSLPSRFLLDIPEELIERTDKNTPKSQTTERPRQSGPIGTRKGSERTGRRQGFEFSSNTRAGSTARPEMPKPKSLLNSNSKGKIKLTPSRRPSPPRPRPGRRAARNATPLFKTGDKVAHDTFGDGIVMSCEPSQDDFQVTVAFKDGHGVKRLLMSFAKLTKVE